MNGRGSVATIGCCLVLVAAWGVVEMGIGGTAYSEELAAGQKKKPHFPSPAVSEGIPLIPPEWKSIPILALTSGELDRLLDEAQQSERVERAPPLTDDQFVRRVFLDLTGRLPPLGEVGAFRALEEPGKRARRIDELLNSDDFARQQARFWRDVIQSRATDVQGFVAYPRATSLELWLYEQFRAKRSWAQITRDLLTAVGQYELAQPNSGGALGFLMCHTSTTEVERANDTARVFLGINFQCAQCHDAPDHVWKRQQFHELAAFFGRLSYRVNPNAKNNYNFITTLVVKPSGEYLTPDAYDETITVPTIPKFFLTGQSAAQNASDQERRAALADFVTSGDNYYFAAALVNRVWGQLMGQAFSRPVDDLGPIQSVIYPQVLLRLAASVRATDYDLRELYRTLLNSSAYQRQFRLPESPGKHLRFAACCPAPLSHDALWSALANTLGPVNGEQFVAKRSTVPLIPPISLRDLFDSTFRFDPSLPASEVEPTVGQALFLMNNAALQANIKAKGETLLAAILAEVPENDGAVRALYLRALGRRPTESELATCLQHIEAVANRGQAFEDIQWALVNSTEFRTRF